METRGASVAAEVVGLELNIGVVRAYVPIKPGRELPNVCTTFASVQTIGGIKMHVTRRQFFKVCVGGLGTSSVAALGFSPVDALAEVREFKLTRSTETRNTCPYCSVSCGLIMHSLGD